jgi:hypothetical protein
MVKFDRTTISDGRLELGGPSTPSPGMEVKHLRFVIAQAGVMVEDEADAVEDGRWRWNGPDGGLQPGVAHGLGVAVMFKAGSPASFETLTWFEEVELTA